MLETPVYPLVLAQLIWAVIIHAVRTISRKGRSIVTGILRDYMPGAIQTLPEVARLNRKEIVRTS